MKNRVFLLVLALALTLLLAACNRATPTPQVGPTPPPAVATTAPAAAAPLDDPSVAAAFQKGGCGACHVIPGIANADGTIGPDLSKIGETAEATCRTRPTPARPKMSPAISTRPSSSRMRTSARACPGGTCQKGLMPATLATALSDQELNAVVSYLAGLPGSAAETSPAASSTTSTVAAAPALPRPNSPTPNRSSSNGVRAATARCARAPPARR